MKKPIEPSEDFKAWQKALYGKVLAGQLRIELGEQKNVIAAELGMMPFEFDAILERARNT